MESIRRILGIEKEVDEVSRQLRYAVQEQNPGIVGALHVTCCEESEHESIESFHRQFAQHLLPSLRYGRQVPCHLATLGGHYEWGAARMTESRYPPPPGAGFKAVLVKLNSHVRHHGESASVLEQPGLDTCHALRAFLDGQQAPFIDELKESFSLEGIDRFAALAKVEARYRMLAAALAHVRLQARKAVLEVQDHKPAAPTLYFVVPGVTLNRSLRDTEIAAGLYVIDRRATPRDEYVGLGDDPSKYKFRVEGGALQVEDESLSKPRAARDHRRLIRESLRDHRPKMLNVFQEVKKRQGGSPSLVKPLLKTLVGALAHAAPGPGALLLFAEGLVGIHHAWRAHKLSRDVNQNEEARRILQEFEHQIEQLSPERAKQVVELLHREYGG
jgi:hypothetical protein